MMLISDMIFLFRIYSNLNSTAFAEFFTQSFMDKYWIDISQYSFGSSKYGVERGDASHSLYQNKNNLLRKTQDRYGFNRKTQICQKGLQTRLINQEAKRISARKERVIQNAFRNDNSRSNRWVRKHTHLK